MKKIISAFIALIFVFLLVGCGEIKIVIDQTTKAPATTKEPAVTTKAPATTKAPGTTKAQPVTTDGGQQTTKVTVVTSKDTEPVSPKTEGFVLDELPEDEINISLWTIFGESKANLLKALIAEFEEMYPNIHVEHTSQSDYNTLREKINKAITTGDPSVMPTVALGYPDHFAGYIQSNAALALDDFINHPVWGVDIDEYIDAYVAENNQYVGGYMYSMPFSKSTEVMAYNKTVLVDQLGLVIPSDRPLTWSEIYDWNDQILEKFDFVLNYDSVANCFINSARQFKAGYTNSEGKILVGSLDDSGAFVPNEKTLAMAQALSFYMSRKTLVIPAQWDESYGSSQFKQGLVAMTVGSSAGTSYNIPAESDADFAKYRYGAFEVGFAPTPQFDEIDTEEAEITYSAVQQGPNIGIFSTATDEERLAAWLLIKYLTYQCKFTGYNEDDDPVFDETQPNTARWAIDTGYIPVTKSAFNSELYSNFLAIGEEYNRNLALGTDESKAANAQLAKTHGKNLYYSLSAIVAKVQIPYYQYDPAFSASAYGKGSATARTQAETALLNIFKGTAEKTALEEMYRSLVY